MFPAICLSAHVLPTCPGHHYLPPDLTRDQIERNAAAMHERLGGDDDSLPVVASVRSRVQMHCLLSVEEGTNGGIIEANIQEERPT